MNLTKIKIGEKAPEEFNVVIEIPIGSAIKYEIDPKTGVLEVDRLIGSASAYPYNYGYIPETLSPDGDALDAMVLSPLAIESKTVVACRPIGLLEMEDEHGKDTKILCVAINESDSHYFSIHDLPDLNLPIREKIKLFFAQYKEIEKAQWSKVQNFGDKKQAMAAIIKARQAAERKD